MGDVVSGYVVSEYVASNGNKNDPVTLVTLFTKLLVVYLLPDRNHNRIHMLYSVKLRLPVSGGIRNRDQPTNKRVPNRYRCPGYMR